MILKPQDILVLLKLISIESKQWSYNRLAVELLMSTSEIHAAIKRSLAARLAIKNGKNITPNIRNLEEFIIHGLKYVFIAEQASMTRGIPTSYAAPPLKQHFQADSEPVPVWSDPEGNTRGLAITPLYKSAPKAAQNDAVLYELLVLVDAIRLGRAREREWAIKEIKARFSQYG